MYKFIANRLFFALAIGATARIFPGIELDGLASALILGFVLSLLDWLLKPVLVLLTLPVTLFTFGLWLFVINTLLVMLASWLVTGFEVETFGAALIFSFAISCINALLDYLFAK
jgi:putative membrane protein